MTFDVSDNGLSIWSIEKQSRRFFGKLDVSFERNQALFCANSEKWGPISQTRFDFTPCFLDAVVLAWALGGLVLSIFVATSLLHKSSNVSIRHYRTWVLSSAVAVTATCITVAQVITSLSPHPSYLIQDIHTWASIARAICFGAVATVQILSIIQLRRPGDSLATFWLTAILLFAVEFYSLLARRIYHHHPASFILSSLVGALLGIEFLIFWPVSAASDTKDANCDQCPLENIGIASKLSVSWMTPLMEIGYKNEIGDDQLYDLPQNDRTKYVGSRFQDAWNKQRKTRHFPLWLTVFKVFGTQYLFAALFKMFSDLLKLAQPQLLRLFLRFVASYNSGSTASPVSGLLIAIGMFAAAFIQSICMNQYLGRTNGTAMRMRAALTAAVHDKATRLSNTATADIPIGAVINHVAVDTQRLEILSQFGHQLWSAPFQLTICLISLYQLVGWSMLAGVVIMVLTIPLNSVIIKRMQSLQIQSMKNKDSRTKLVIEIISNIKSIKLLGWQSNFLSSLRHLRNTKELKALRSFSMAQASAGVIWSTSPFLVSCATFVAFTLEQNGTLTAELIFPALSLFNLLSFPLAAFPMAISGAVEANIAVNRLQTFFTANELQSDAVARQEVVGPEAGVHVATIRNAAFSWEQKLEQPSLQITNFDAKARSLCCIIGSVGSGKSTFLRALLGDIWKVRGDVHLAGSVAYVPQVPWIQSSSVRENIVFGHIWDPQYYSTVIEACALQDDLSNLTNHDETKVGGQGITLSGGQKARIALARALYARADVYLLDDCLSAVDQHVGRHLIDRVFGPQGLLRDKTRIFATNSFSILPYADQILLLKDGRVVEESSFQEAHLRRGAIAQLLDSHSREKNIPRNQSEGGNGSLPKSTEVNPLHIGDIISAGTEPISEPSVDTMTKQMLAQFKTRVRNLKSQSGDSEAAISSRVPQRASWTAYLDYAHATSLSGLILYFVSLVASEAASAGSRLWIKVWADSNQRSGANQDVPMYIGVYFAFGAASAAANVVGDVCLYVLCGLTAARNLHERLADSVFSSPMSFFETTTSGKILNRFTSDTYQVDEVIAPIFGLFFSAVSGTIVALVIISAGFPSFLIAVFILGLVYFKTQLRFVCASQQLKRLDSESKSLVYNHIQESLAGNAVIRAMNHLDRFKHDLEQSTDENLRAQFASLHANRWLSIRLELIGSTSVLVAGCLSVFVTVSDRAVSAGLVGLIMSYAVQISSCLDRLVHVNVNLENNIISVERVIEYTRLPAEGHKSAIKQPPRASWPEDGSCLFENYSSRYQDGLPNVLQNINIDIKHGEKIGVVGRTGAGKSSLAMALFRIIEATQGHIDVGASNIFHIELETLRRRLCIIPQDSAIFAGTVRSNLDPERIRDDTELWAALDQARLKTHVSNMEGQLDARIDEGGSNISTGQRQLVSLARVFLRKSPLLVLDEATSAIDQETDAVVQQTLRGEAFADRTIITIAHRLNTIMDYDRVLVLERGKVAEFDTPMVLLERKDGLFYALVKEAGLIGGD